LQLKQVVSLLINLFSLIFHVDIEALVLQGGGSHGEINESHAGAEVRGEHGTRVTRDHEQREI
jgi:hypothetical protein